MAKIKSRDEFPYSLTFFLLLRLVLVFPPQTGYVVPEEFTRGAHLFSVNKIDNKGEEKVWFGGDKLSNQPTTSIAVAYIFYGWSYNLLQMLEDCSIHLLKTSIITPQTLLVLPRLALCLSSYLVDFSLYRICLLSGNSYQSKMLILSSSYGMLIYSSHTLVNVKESILFALLLYLVIDHRVCSSIDAKKYDNLLKRLVCTTNKDTRKILKKRLQSVDKPYRKIIPVAIVSVLGLFNRPGFLLFAITPIFFCLFSGMKHRLYAGYMRMCKRCLVLLVAMLTMIALMIAADTLLYTNLSLPSLFDKGVLNSQFVITPWNQLIATGIEHAKDSKDTDWYIARFVGQMLLLFHILGWYTFIGMVKYVNRCKPSKRSATLTQLIPKFIIMSTLSSIGAISLTIQPVSLDFLPLLMPFAYFSGDQIKSYHKNPERPTNDLEKTKEVTSSNSLFITWMATNTLFALFFGFLCEAGTISATFYLAKQHQANPVEYHVITSHVYAIPQTLLMQQEYEREIFLHEYGSASLETVIEQIITLRYEAFVSDNEYKLYLLMPACKHKELFSALKDSSRLHIKLEKKFFPHFSFAVLPDIDAGALMAHSLKLISDEVFHYQSLNVTKALESAMSTFHLNLYSINP